MAKSRAANNRFVPGTSRGVQSAHTLLLQMAKEAQELAEQAARIVELREQKGREEGRLIAQPEVAEAAGVGLRAYQNWEAGRSDPEREHLNALADYFGVSSDYIEFGVEKRQGGATAAITRPLLKRLERIEANTEAILALLTGEDAETTATVAELEALPDRVSQADAKPKRRAPARSAKN